MARPFTAKVPDAGVFVQRDSQGRLWVFKVTVSCLGQIEPVAVQGRHVYRTPDGGVYSNAQVAAEHLASEDEPCSPS